MPLFSVCLKKPKVQFLTILCDSIYPRTGEEQTHILKCDFGYIFPTNFEDMFLKFGTSTLGYLYSSDMIIQLYCYFSFNIWVGKILLSFTWNTELLKSLLGSNPKHLSVHQTHSVASFGQILGASGINIQFTLF
jgi:hypothetical protein